MLRIIFWIVIGLWAIGSASNYFLPKSTQTPSAIKSGAATQVESPTQPSTKKSGAIERLDIPNVSTENRWQLQTTSSAIDDSKTVYLQISSDTDIAGRFSGEGPAILHLRCLENTTSAAFAFNGLFMADIQGYGDITYRIDAKPAVTRKFDESTNHEWLGLWKGGSSIPFIKSLVGSDKLTVRATPFSENSVQTSFSTFGLGEKLGELRKACGW